MKVLDVEQNTLAWEELRRSKIGASDIAIIMTGSKGEVYDLYLSKVAGKKKFVTFAMQRGHDLEDEARTWINIHKDLDFAPVVAVSDEHDWLMASFDGFDPEMSISLEIKCPGEVPNTIGEHRSYTKWWWQMQAQYAVGGHDNAIMLMYSPEKQCFGFIPKDEEAIKQLLKKGKEFYDRVVNYDPPEDAVEERFDPEVLEAVEAWKRAKEAKDLADEVEELAKGRLIALAGEKSFKAAGVNVLKCYRRGAIEYKQIIQLKDIDLEQYRKGAIAYWKVG